MNIEFHTSQRFTTFGSLAADEYISNYLTTIFNRHGKENIMKYEIFFLPDGDFRVGVTIVKPDVKEHTVQETQNLIKI
jgi:hypothetical protein